VGSGGEIFRLGWPGGSTAGWSKAWGVWCARALDEEGVGAGVGDGGDGGGGA